MIEIDDSKKTVSVVLNTRFYPKEKIEGAVKDFSKVCKVKLEDVFESKSIAKKAFLMSEGESNSLKVSLTPKTKDVDLNTLGYEFCNYLLAEIKGG